MGAVVHLDTDDAEQRLQRLIGLAREIARAEQRNGARALTDADVVQIIKRWQKRNGEHS